MAVTAITPYASFSGGPIPIIATGEGEWAMATIIAHSTGLLLATQGVNNVTSGMIVPVDMPVEILMAPNSRLFAGAPNTSTAFSVIYQPLPFIARLALTVQRLFSMKSAA